MKLYDFNIVDGELKRTQNVVVPGSEAADGMWQKNMLTMNQTTGKAIIQLILHYVLLFEHLELLELRATSTAGKTDVIFVVYSRRKTRPFLFSLFSLILVANH